LQVEASVDVNLMFMPLFTPHVYAAVYAAIADR
jgi:hypothetical protein